MVMSTQPGNQESDEQIIQIVERLLDLSPSQKTERVLLLLAMGQRYATLARESEDQDETISPVALSKKRLAGYKESSVVLTSALDQTDDPEVRAQIMEALATSLMGVGQAIVASYLHTCLQTLHLDQAKGETFRVLCRRALMLLTQGQDDAAKAELQRLLMVVRSSEYQHD